MKQSGKELVVVGQELLKLAEKVGRLINGGLGFGTRWVFEGLREICICHRHETRIFGRVVAGGEKFGISLT